MKSLCLFPCPKVCLTLSRNWSALSASPAAAAAAAAEARHDDSAARLASLGSACASGLLGGCLKRCTAAGAISWGGGQLCRWRHLSLASICIAPGGIGRLPPVGTRTGGDEGGCGRRRSAVLI
jgi:hypothetical protein